MAERLPVLWQRVQAPGRLAERRVLERPESFRAPGHWEPEQQEQARRVPIVREQVQVVKELVAQARAARVQVPASKGWWRFAAAGRCRSFAASMPRAQRPGPDYHLHGSKKEGSQG